MPVNPVLKKQRRQEKEKAAAEAAQEGRGKDSQPGTSTKEEPSRVIYVG